ncbi:two-component system, NarL family, response regulator DesR [Variovorax sp. HW608]|nr:two-component system, NarL family, response regulator DesR [Variovorax sp. HW608]
MVADTTKAMLHAMSSEDPITITTHATAKEVIQALEAQSQRWDLILLDLDVPGATGLSLAAHIKDAGLAPVTCILTGTGRPDYVAQTFKDEFQGYILKSSPTSDLDAYLQSALMGKKVFPAPDTDAAQTNAVALTKRQREVLQLVGTGSTSKQIARYLGVAPGTVDNHIHASIAALGVRTRAEAVAKALMLGFIEGQLETASAA